MEITIKNLHTVKMSDLFESVLYDLEKVQKNKIGIDMNSYFYSDSKECTVCLGGAAICGFMSSRISKKHLLQADEVIMENITSGTVDGFEVTKTESQRLRNMARMFDSFRSGWIEDSFCWYNNINVGEKKIVGISLTGEQQSCFYGLEKEFMRFRDKLNKSTIKMMKGQIISFVLHLRKHGL